MAGHIYRICCMIAYIMHYSAKTLTPGFRAVMHLGDENGTCHIPDEAVVTHDMVENPCPLACSVT